MTDKILPHSQDFETSVIAGLLIDQDYSRIALDLLKPSDFYSTAYQQIFEAASNLAGKGEPVDLVTVKEQLNGLISASDLARIVDFPVPVNISAYCRKLQEYAKRRELIEITNDVQADAFDTSTDFSELLDDAKTDIQAIDSGADDTFQGMPTMTMESVNRYIHKHKRPGIKTGFAELDAITGGLIGSALMIIAARPGIGKTAMMLCMARYMARAGHHVGIFSIEMDAAQLMDRLFSMETGINSVRLSTGAKLDRAEADLITRAAETVSEWPIVIDDTGGISIAELKRRCRRMKKAGVEIIFIDQLSKITGGQGRSEYERKTDIVNQISALAKELRIPVVLLAQINRNIEGRADKSPTLADLKSTGSLEEDADLILLGHREYIYSQDPADKYKAQWELAKHRAGPTRVLYFAWDPKRTLFEDLKNV